MKKSLPLLTIIASALLATGVTVSASQHSGGDKGHTESGQERVEMEMEKHTRQESTADDARKNAEQTRTTEEMHKEAGKASDMAEPARETSRRWWEFWK